MVSRSFSDWGFFLIKIVGGPQYLKQPITELFGLRVGSFPTKLWGSSYPRNWLCRLGIPTLGIFHCCADIYVDSYWHDVQLASYKIKEPVWFQPRKEKNRGQNLHKELQPDVNLDCSDGRNGGQEGELFCSFILLSFFKFSTMNSSLFVRVKKLPFLKNPKNIWEWKAR